MKVAQSNPSRVKGVDGKKKFKRRIWFFTAFVCLQESHDVGLRLILLVPTPFPPAAEAPG